MTVHLYLAAPQYGKSFLMRRHVYEDRGSVRFLINDRDNKSTWMGPVFTSARAFREAETIARWSVFRGVPACEICELAIDLGDSCYVDEEIHRALLERPWKTWDRTEQGRRGHPLYAILHEGAHLENAFGESSTVSALLATRRPANLPSDLIALCDGVYLGHLKSYVDADRCYREGLVPGADGPRAARATLEARGVGDFELVRCQ